MCRPDDYPPYPIVHPPSKPAPRRLTQNQRVLGLLLDRGARGITALDAMALCGTYRLAARVYDLRRRGWAIGSRREVTPNGTVIARYALGGRYEGRDNG